MTNILHFKNFNKIFFLFIIVSCSDKTDDPINEEEKNEPTTLVPLGYNKFTFNSYAPLADKPIDVHTYLPRADYLKLMAKNFAFGVYL